jgi:hypothetical protein
MKEEMRKAISDGQIYVGELQDPTYLAARHERVGGGSCV